MKSSDKRMILQIVPCVRGSLGARILQCLEFIHGGLTIIFHVARNGDTILADLSTEAGNSNPSMRVGRR